MFQNCGFFSFFLLLLRGFFGRVVLTLTRLAGRKHDAKETQMRSWLSFSHLKFSPPSSLLLLLHLPSAILGSCGDSLEMLWRFRRDCFKILWRFCGDSVEIVSRLFGNYWRYLHIFGDWSRFSEIPKDSWRFLKILWRFCGDCGDDFKTLWKLLKILAHIWRLVKIFRDSWRFLKILWRFFGDSWRCSVILGVIFVSLNWIFEEFLRVCGGISMKF